MALFAAGQPLTAQLLNDVIGERKRDIQNTSGTTTSTSYTETLTGGTPCALTFVAPRSGKVDVHNTAQSVNSGATGTAVLSFIIRTGSTIGSGSTVLDAGDPGCALNQGTSNNRYTAVYPVEGLTPGATYNIRQQFKTNSGTATFSNKTLAVVPQP